MKSERSNGKLIGALIFFIALSVVLGAFIVYDKFIAKNEVKEVDNNNNATDDKKSNSDNKNSAQSSYEEFLASEIANRTDKVIEKYNNDMEDNGYEILLTKSGDVIANVKTSYEDRKDIVNQVIESKVVNYFIVKLGMSDVLDIRELVFIKEDGTITSLSLGNLIHLGEVKINKNYALKNITEVYDKVTTPATEYEPAGYSVFVKDIDGKETDITKLIEATRN